MITTHTILIVDDNINNLKVAVTHLKAYSYKILVASTGLDGVSRAQLAQPDLILLDLMMPDIDGFEVCARLKANPTTAEIPIIFMTAVADTAHKTRGLKEGAVDYITKPVDSTELLLRVRTHLKLRDLQLNLEQEVAQNTTALTTLKSDLKRLNSEKQRLYEALASQTGQLNLLTHQTVREQVQGNPAVQHFLSTQLQPCISQTLQNLQDMKRELKEKHPHALMAISSQLDGSKEQLLNLSQSLTEMVDTVAAKPQITLTELYKKLSDREYQTLKMLAHRMSNADIATAMSITPATVTTYRRRIMQKLDMEDAHSLLQLAMLLQLHEEEL